MWATGIVILASAIAGQSFDLVRDGLPKAAIVTPESPAAEEQAAAGELAHYLLMITGTGADITICAESDSPGGPQVHVGATAAAGEAGIPPADLDRDGLVLKVSGDRLFLCGKTPAATQFAVTRFLQTQCGCRWYMPTELGEHIPRSPNVVVPDSLDVVEEPSYLSRLWSAPSNMDSNWPRRNYVRRRFDFHHNLLHVFEPEVYEEHPEFFPLIEGERRRPSSAEDHGWQPCFANREAAKYAASVAAKAFEADPSRPSFSLGINDSNTYCRCDACEALDDPERPEFRGRPNMSNRVFHFMNNVAEELAPTYPDKYLGCLAYSWCEDVPSFPADDRIVPYLTNDRAQWLDPEFKALDQELIRRWCAEQPVVGIYDYYYGSGYVIPRVFCHLSDDSLKFCHRTGVRAFYAEIYENWSLDGPKAWVASQLLWDVDQDVDALLSDYYSGFFGESAGPMRRYFELCERRWVNQEGPARWFKGFFDIGQMEIFPPDVCRKARGLLDQAAAQATSEVVRERVKLYSEGFHYTELYADLYWANKTLERSRIRTGAELNRGLEAAERLGEASAELESYYAEVIEPNPLHRSPIPFTERGKFDPLSGLVTFLTHAMSWADAHGEWEAVEAFAARLAAEQPDLPAGRLARALTYLHDDPGAGTEMIRNGSVEEGAAEGPQPEGIDWQTDEMPVGWAKWLRPGTPGELVLTDERARTGKASFRATGAAAACFLQTVPVQPGEEFLCRCHVWARVSEGSRTELLIQWKDAEGNWVKAPASTVSLPVGDTGGWEPLQAFFTVPEGVAGAVVGLVTYDQADGDYAYFDDMSCLRLEIPEPEATREAR